MQKFYFADGHCDTATALSRLELVYGTEQAQLDLNRFTKWQALQFFAFFIKDQGKPKEAWMQLIAYYQNFMQALKENNKAEVLQNACQIQKQRKPLALLALEGVGLFDAAQTLDDKYNAAAFLFSKGFRSMGLFWNNDNWAGCGANANLPDQRDDGLTQAGKEFVRFLDAQGFLIDLAHSSEKSFWDSLWLTKRPVIVTHACCAGLRPHKRNLSDSQIQALADQGGLLGLTFVPDFLVDIKRQQATAEDVAAHILYALKLAGENAVGLGSDFDGTDALPLGIEGPESYPALYQLLRSNGLTSSQTEKVMGGNWRRFLRENLPD